MSPQNNIFKPKKKSEKRELAKVQVVQPNGTSWHKLAQVEEVEQVEAGLQIYVDVQPAGVSEFSCYKGTLRPCVKSSYQFFRTPNSNNQQAAEPVPSGGSFIEYANDASELSPPSYGL